MQSSTETMANDGKIFTVTFYGDKGTKRACIRRMTGMNVNSSDSLRTRVGNALKTRKAMYCC